MYIECIFDEIATEVKVLFDRRDPASLLWPRRQALHDLLDVLNRQELADIWAEDETIGWVYQYFNSQEERQQMRSESQAPRNSRELAVRNQFFTPRYVVQFLTDNTLGRIWYEMRKGDTHLVDHCEYLVRRPNEIFLAEDEEAPEQDIPEDLSQEELLKLPVHIPHRPKKDPRDLKILDPACGSGHFLLYCFDLLASIYEEAWHDPDSPTAREALGPDGKSPAQKLRDDYADPASLRRDMPGLILRHNLHGIEIDSRCAQIAALSLWMRAQRAFNDFGCPRDARPRIEKTNMVVAEPMPGEQEMLQEFTATLNPPLLGQLVEVIFDKMKLAGEVGSLLKIEQEIADAVSEARKLWAAGPEALQLKLFGEQAIRQRKLDFSGIDDETWWHEAEGRIYEALRHYAQQAANGRSFTRKLFAEDAQQGFAFIDLCRRKYDVALANPPFGKVPRRAEKYLRKEYSGSWTDVYAAFLDRLHHGMAYQGSVGCISSSLFLYTKQMRRLRKGWLSTRSLHHLAELGSGVLDTAAVDTALTITLSYPAQLTRFVDLTSSEDKGADLLAATDAHCAMTSVYVVPLEVFKALYLYPFCYHLDPVKLRLWSVNDTLDPSLATVVTGNHSFDDFRFLRLRWEVDPREIGLRWYGYEKGGDYQPFFSPTHVLYLWADDGLEACAYQVGRFGIDSQVRQSSKWWWQQGLTYPRVSSIGFGPRLMPSGHIFSGDSISIFPKAERDLKALLAMLASSWAQDLLYAFGRYRKIEVRATSNLPIDKTLISGSHSILEDLAERGLQLALRLESTRETSPIFLCPARPDLGSGGSAANLENELTHILQGFRQLSCELDTVVASLLFKGPPPEIAAPRRSVLADRFVLRELSSEGAIAVDWLSYGLGCVFGRWKPGCVPDGDRPDLAEGLRQLPELPPGSLEEDASGHKARTVAVLVDDAGHPGDIVSRAMDSVESCWTGDGTAFAAWVAKGAADDAMADEGLRRWFGRKFFGLHVAKYSKSRRKAPIYWQLATPTASYSVWLYYHRFTKDTFYKVLNDYVKPKLDHEQRKLSSVTQQAGGNPTASQRREIAAQETFVEELRAFREEVERIAPLWNPDLNDGVIINFAPLWRLVAQHRQWQKECKDCWDKLVAGNYDWAHLAMHLWPERVVPKCHTDRSLAIAHDLEDDLWEAYEDDRGREQWRPKDVPKERIKELIAERTSPAVKAALESLLNAPAPAGGATRRRGKGRRKAVK